MSSLGAPKSLWLNVPGAKTPEVDEFLAHPEFRQVATFFLGGVFIISLKCILSTLFKTVLGRASGSLQRRFLPTENGDPEAFPDSSSEKSHSKGRISANLAQCILIFTLSLCFAFASLAHMFSLLIFDPSRGGVCAFVVAWGGMTSQMARLVGVIILMLELRRLGIPLWERILQVIAVVIGAALIFTSNAISFGVVVVVPLLNQSLCYRRYFLATSLASSVFYIFLELFITLRLLSSIAPSFLSVRHRLASLRDVRIVRGLSLLFLDLLTVIPGAVWINILASFIPFSVGALAVLAAFNRHHEIPAESSANSIPSINSGPPSRVSTARVATPKAVESSANSIPSARSEPPSRASTVRVAPLRISKPRTTSLVPSRKRAFASQDISASEVAGDRSQIIDEWQSRQIRTRRFPLRTLTTHSDTSVDTVAAKSIKNAVVSVAKYAKLSPVAWNPKPQPNRVVLASSPPQIVEPVPALPTPNATPDPPPQPESLNLAQGTSAPQITFQLVVEELALVSPSRTSISDLSGFEIIQLYGNNIATDPSNSSQLNSKLPEPGISDLSPTESTPRPFARQASWNSTSQGSAIAEAPSADQLARQSIATTQNDTTGATAGTPTTTGEWDAGMPDRESVALIKNGLPSTPRLRPGQWSPGYKGAVAGPQPPPRALLPMLPNLASASEDMR